MIITALAVISPYGTGTQAFADGVRSGRPALSSVAGVPYPTAGVATGLDVAALLGRTKVPRGLGRPGGMATGAAALLLREHDVTGVEPGRRGVVLGGDLMTTDRAMEIMRESLTGDLPYHVDTKLFPGSVMNHAAAQCAIMHGFTGPNSTVSAGRVTGLAVLSYARRLHLSGRASVVLAGAVEDLNPRRSWITWHGHGQQSTEPLGEGCCLFLTESRESASANGRAPVAQVLALEFGAVARPGDVAITLAGLIGRALGHTGVTAEEVSTTVLSGVEGDGEHAAVRGALGKTARTFFLARLIGDTSGAAGSLQLAAAIVESAPEPRIALVTAVDPDGQVGCGLFRIPPS